MTRFIPVQGTEGWQVDDPDPRHPRNWWREGSLFLEALALYGIRPVAPDDPFVWSTELDGVRFWQRWTWFKSRQDKRAWLACGKALRWYAARYVARHAPVVLVTHSHGLQGALYAAAEGLRIDYLLDIAGPLRGDVLRETGAGLANIGQWMRVTDDERDVIQFLGGIGDGDVGAVRIPDSVIVKRVPDIDHSELLSNPVHVPATLLEHGLIDFLLQAEGVLGV